MIFDLSVKPPKDEYRKWHRHYAWLPTCLNDDKIAWFEWVERRAWCTWEGTWAWAYRMVKNEN